MNKLLISVVLLFMSVPVLADENSDLDLVERLQKISFAVTTERGSGSGVLITKNSGKDKVSFILTAAHVITSARHVKTVIDGTTGTTKKQVYFDDVEVVKINSEDGREVGRASLKAKVVKYNRDEDLAVLQIRTKNFSNETTLFYREEKLPRLGSEVWNVGSALGLEGFNTVSKGIISHQGRLLEGKVYDQVSCPAFPGCSGSGLFLKNGRMIGTLTNGSGETFILCVPTRRILEWGKDARINWLFDENLNVPSEKVLNKIPVEDNGKDSAFDLRYLNIPFITNKTMDKPK